MPENMVDDREIGLPVQIQVGRRHREREVPERVIDPGLEAAVAVAEQHRDAAETTLATARSGLPSPFKSPAATSNGPLWAP